MYAKSLSKSRFYCPIQKYGENRGGDEQYRRETEGEREVVVVEAAAASRRMKSQGRINGGSDTTSTNQTPNRKPPYPATVVVAHRWLPEGLQADATWYKKGGPGEAWI
jgi:hypothetical protein